MMKSSRSTRLRLAATAAMGGMLVGSAAAAAPAAGPPATACPTAPLPTGPGAPGPGGGVPPIPMAKTVAPGDTSTSIVIHPDATRQISCGRTPLKTHNDVVFGHAKAPNGADLPLAMDILVPDTPGKKPLVVYVPGGGFVIAPKDGGLDLRSYVAEAGFVVASISYRTVLNRAIYRDGVADVKSAIRFLRAHADEYGIDGGHVAVWGESAGGYLVAMVGVTNGDHSFDVGDNLTQSSAVQAVVDKFGASDVSKVALDFDVDTQHIYGGPGPLAMYVGGFRPGGGLVDPASDPIAHIAASDPPFLIFHGNADHIVSPSQTLALHNALRAAGVKSARYVLDGANHGDLAFLGDPKAGLAWSSRQTMDIIVDFLRKTL